MTLTTEAIYWIVGTVLVVGFFTDFYGLGSRWTNRGNWWLIIGDEELAKVLSNLEKLKAFQDSDGINNAHIKVQVFSMPDERHYRVKIPNWIFKYEQVKLTKRNKAEMLGLTWQGNSVRLDNIK